MPKLLAHDHVVTIQCALNLAAFKLRKRARELTETEHYPMDKEWLLNEADNIDEALAAFKQVHGLRKPYSRAKPADLMGPTSLVSWDPTDKT